jgi:predicted RNase H-like nuclease (RuvC/YqgF family)
MARFKDIATGNIFEFTSEHDIQTMRKHPEYTEVVEVQEQPVLKKPLTTKKQLKEV